MKDPEQVIKTHYYRAKALEERFIRIRDSSSSKARKNAYNEDVKIHTAIAAELLNLYAEIYLKQLF